jgi:hypothetical protein
VIHSALRRAWLCCEGPGSWCRDHSVRTWPAGGFFVQYVSLSQHCKVTLQHPAQQPLQVC